MSERRSFLKRVGLGIGLVAIAKPSLVDTGCEKSYTRFEGHWVRLCNGELDSFVGIGEVIDMVGLDGLHSMIDQDEKRSREKMFAALNHSRRQR